MMMMRTTTRRKICEVYTSHAALLCILKIPQIDEACCTDWQPNAPSACAITHPLRLS